MLLIFATHCKFISLHHAKERTHLINDTLADINSGGLGLTGGLADIGSLYECLVGIHEGKASLDILDKYDEIRQQKFNQIINPVSIANLERMFADPNTVLEHDQGLQRVIEVGKNAESSRAFQLVGINHSSALIRPLT